MMATRPRTIRLRKVGDGYDPEDRVAATCFMEAHRAAGEVVTGRLSVHADTADMHDAMEAIDVPLNALGDAAFVPGGAALAKINAQLR